jgi:hypothetical protein
MTTGYRKIEAQVKPAQHIVTVTNGMTAASVKELFSHVPGMSIINQIASSEGDIILCFVEDEARYKIEYQE